MWNVRESGETIKELNLRPEVNKSPTRTWHIKEAENIVDLENIFWMCLNWIRVAYFTDSRRRLNYMVMTCCFSFWKGILLQGVELLDFQKR